VPRVIAVEHVDPPLVDELDSAPSPQDWATRLGKRLRRQRKHARQYDAYYTGERELAIVRRDFEEVFGNAGEGERVLDLLLPQLPTPRANVSRVGVEAYVEKMRLEDFLVGGAEPDTQGAKDAAEILARNDFDEAAPTAHRESFIKGVAFALVWPDADGNPVVTIEDATQVAIARQSAPPYDVIAAVKVYKDEWTDREVTAVYDADGCYTFRRVKGRGLVEDERAFEPAPEVFGGRVPMVELSNRQRLLDPPSSVLVDVAPLADNHAKLLADMVIAASFGAIPIRTATGIKLRFENGEVVSPFDIRADRILTSENPNAKYGQLDGANLAGYVSAQDMLLTLLRLVTRVPQHYYGVGASAGMSGETLRASEASLNAMISGALPMFGGGHRRWMRLALMLKDSRYATIPIRPLWGPVETRIPSVEVDAFQKAVASNVPPGIAAREFLRWRPEQVAELEKALKEQQAADAALLFARIPPAA
jgi:hypothetical protein